MCIRDSENGVAGNLRELNLDTWALLLFCSSFKENFLEQWVNTSSSLYNSVTETDYLCCFGAYNMPSLDDTTPRLSAPAIGIWQSACTLRLHLSSLGIQDAHSGYSPHIPLYLYTLSPNRSTFNSFPTIAILLISSFLYPLILLRHFVSDVSSLPMPVDGDVLTALQGEPRCYLSGLESPI